MAKIILNDSPSNEISVALEMIPPNLEMVVAKPGSPEFKAALADAVCLVGFGDRTMDDAFYKSAPNLKLVRIGQKVLAEQVCFSISLLQSVR